MLGGFEVLQRLNDLGLLAIVDDLWRVVPGVDFMLRLEGSSRVITAFLETHEVLLTLVL